MFEVSTFINLCPTNLSSTSNIHSLLLNKLCMESQITSAKNDKLFDISQHIIQLLLLQTIGMHLLSRRPPTFKSMEKPPQPATLVQENQQKWSTRKDIWYSRCHWSILVAGGGEQKDNSEAQGIDQKKERVLEDQSQVPKTKGRPWDPFVSC